jgi:hypothetical protein
MGVGEARHVGTDLGEDDVSGPVAHAGNRGQQADRMGGKLIDTLRFGSRETSETMD